MGTICCINPMRDEEIDLHNHKIQSEKDIGTTRSSKVTQLTCVKTFLDPYDHDNYNSSYHSEDEDFGG
jgi:hypothetical protein